MKVYKYERTFVLENMLTMFPEVLLHGQSTKHLQILKCMRAPPHTYMNYIYYMKKQTLKCCPTIIVIVDEDRLTLQSVIDMKCAI